MDNLIDSIWVEKYRPKKLEDCILPERLKTPFREYLNKGEVQNLLIHGTAGIGKTTVAMALCEELRCDYMMINGSDESGIDTFRYKIKNYASSMSLSGGKKVIIIDEADYLNPASTQPALRGGIEEFSKNCNFILTCNYKNKIIEPLHSRCAVLDFTLKGSEKLSMASQFFKRVQFILDDMKITYDNQVVAELIKKHFPDFRRTINELQRYSTFGNIDSGILAQISNIKVSEVIGYMKDKNFGAIRKWIGSNEIDPTSIFRQIYDILYDVMKPHSIPQAVIIIADYQYKQAFVADNEINLVACLTELMVSCEFT